jgi:hypothetical protein
MTVKVSKSAINLREKLAKVDKPTGIAGEAMLRAETPQEQFNLIGAGRRNIIINGDMKIAQRGTVSGITSAKYGGPDHIGSVVTDNGITNTATLTAQQSTDAPDGFSYSHLTTIDSVSTGLTASGVHHLRFPVEGYDAIQTGFGTSNAKYVTLSFWVKCSYADTFCAVLVNHDQQTSAFAYYTVDQANTWEYKTITFPPDSSGPLNSDNTLGISLDMYLAGGTAYTGSTNPEYTWNTRVNNDSSYLTKTSTQFGTDLSHTIQFTGVQLELGKVATPFERRSYGEELALCERYFQSMDGSIHAHPCWTYSTNNASTTFYPRTRMRTTPTFTRNGTLETGSVSTGFSYYQAGVWLGLSALSFDTGGSSQDGFRIDLTTNTAHNDAGGAGGLYIGTEASFHFDAEI